MVGAAESSGGPATHASVKVNNPGFISTSLKFFFDPSSGTLGYRSIGLPRPAPSFRISEPVEVETRRHEPYRGAGGRGFDGGGRAPRNRRQQLGGGGGRS